MNDIVTYSDKFSNRKNKILVPIKRNNRV